MKTRCNARLIMREGAEKHIAAVEKRLKPWQGRSRLAPNRQLHKTRSKLSEHFEMRFSIGLLR
jgi:hypothetical protein